MVQTSLHKLLSISLATDDNFVSAGWVLIMGGDWLIYSVAQQDAS